MSGYHEPVMPAQTFKYLQISPGRLYVDATVGGGGHTHGILSAGGQAVALDRDQDAIDHVYASVSDANLKNLTLIKSNFSQLKQIIESQGLKEVNGILFDLGVSSHHLDSIKRGFSYRFDMAPIDLRMDQSQPLMGSELINSLSEEKLYEIFSTYGEEEHSRAIAFTIVRSRKLTPIETMGDFKRVIRQVCPETPQVYARLLQALRIYINDELSELKVGLESAEQLLAPGGRLVVLSYHSLEDRIVKLFMRHSQQLIELTKLPIRASEDEIRANSRSKSARLRAAEKKYI